MKCFLCWCAFAAFVVPHVDIVAASSTVSSVSSRVTVPPEGVSLTFTIVGATPKTVLVRAVGPSLAVFGVPGSAADPKITITNSGGTVVGSNDDWASATAISTATAQVGAFALSPGSKDAAMVLPLAPGTYSVTATTTGGSGVALLEVYDCDQGVVLSTFSRVSFRGPAGNGANTMLVGFVTKGDPMAVLVRALGPALSSLGVSGGIADPSLMLFNSQGAVLLTNDNWGNDPVVAAITTQAGAPALGAGSKDSAVLTTLPAGPYTAQITNLGGTSGTAQFDLYATTSFTVAPTFKTQPAAQVVAEGSTATFNADVPAYPTPTYQWFKNGVAIAGATDATLTLRNVQPGDAADYTVSAQNAAASVTSTAARLSVTPTAWLTNLSVRTSISEGQIITMGAVVTGGAQDVLFRAAGPALTPFGISTAVTNPKLAVFDERSLKVNENDDWISSLSPTILGAGAFAFIPGSRDAALVQRIAGNTTIQGSASGPGVVLLEAYALNSIGLPRLTNLSVRGRASSGDAVLIAGFAVAGSGTKQLLIRGIGPSLAAFGVGSPLIDPKIEIYDSKNRLVAQNDNWDSAHATTMTQVGAFRLDPGTRDAAVVVTLPPDSYTAVVSAPSGTAGEALIEVYEIK